MFSVGVWLTRTDTHTHAHTHIHTHTHTHTHTPTQTRVQTFTSLTHATFHPLHPAIPLYPQNLRRHPTPTSTPTYFRIHRWSPCSCRRAGRSPRSLLPGRRRRRPASRARSTATSAAAPRPSSDASPSRVCRNMEKNNAIQCWCWWGKLPLFSA